MDRLQNARQMIGRARDEPATPALILDLHAVERNIAEMARRMAGLPAALRPHAKIHKSPILGRMQLDAGAIGLTTATIWEASAMIDAGLSDVLIAEPGDRPDQGCRARAARRARAGDRGRREPSNADELAEAARRAKSEIGVLVEVDVGPAPFGRPLGRRGRRARRRTSSGLPGLRLRGPARLRGPLHARAGPRRYGSRRRRPRTPSFSRPSTRSTARASPPRSSPPAGSAPGTSPARTRGSPRSTRARTSSRTRSIATSSPGSTSR